MSDLIDLLKYEGKDISNLFEKASIEGKGTPQEVSDRREAALINFVKKYFPFPFRVTKGNIVDSYGKRSASIDCIVLNPSHPYTTADDSKYSIILADAVDCAIELKPDLNSQIEIERGLKQIKTVKELKRIRHGLLRTKGESPEYIESCKQVPCFIFSNKAYESERQLLETIVSYYEREKIKKELQFDFIFVNNRFFIVNSKKYGYFNLKGEAEGLYIVHTNELTVAAFLFYLNVLPKSEPRLAPSFLESYLNLKSDMIWSYEYLNIRLRQIK